MITKEMILLRKEIVANPLDDTIRLAYADLCNEVGGQANDEYAQFIRLQVKNAIDPVDMSMSSIGQIVEENKRADEFIIHLPTSSKIGITKHDLYLLSYYGYLFDDSPCLVTYHRGFIDGLIVIGDNTRFFDPHYELCALTWMTHFPVTSILPLMNIGRMVSRNHRVGIIETQYHARVFMKLIEHLIPESNKGLRQIYGNRTNVVFHANSRNELQEMVSTALCKAMRDMLNCTEHEDKNSDVIV